MVTERLSYGTFLMMFCIGNRLSSEETFCVFVKKPVKTFLFFVKKQGKTFRVFVKKCIIGESKHCAGGFSWNHSIIPK